MKRNGNIKELDRRIGAMLCNESEPVPEDKWFVNKTLNRLPMRHRRIFGVPEIVAFLIVVTASIVITIHELKVVMSMPDPADFNPMLMLSAAAMALFATLYISIPLLRNA
ncbi:MAG: hypothetical protein K2J97_00225 [Muribaculaceae bacterium]|nr:hypothetical protein [Muribaculaceae bacterium]